MKITVDKLKYRKRLFSLTIVAILFGVGSILITIINLIEHGNLTIERILAVIGLMLFSAFFAYLTKHFYQLRKIENVIVFEKGVLNDHTKLFNKAVNLKIQDVQSIGLWTESKGVSQYKIITKNHESRRNGLYNQLKGYDIYLTDYVVDSNELYELVKLIESETKNTNKAKAPKVLYL